MAEADKSEQATPRRREDARKKGQVAKSQEVGSALVLLAGFSTLGIMGEVIYRRIAVMTAWTYSPEYLSKGGVNQENIGYLFVNVFNFGAAIMAPVLVAAVVVGVGANLLQTGFMLTAAPLAPDLNKINPIKGFQRIFSMRGLQELVKSLVKIGLVSLVAWASLRGLIPSFVNMMQMEVVESARIIGAETVSMAVKVAVLMILIAMLDFAYQKFEYEKNLRMSKQEVKDEMKQREGDPLTRSRIRQKQREFAMRRMMAEVPKADVVITNPVHYAVALQYEFDQMHAPKVVAKGAGVVAERIKEIARENNIPIVEDKPLAQSLFKLADIGEYIPAQLYKATAEILAYVYKLSGKQNRFGL